MPTCLIARIACKIDLRQEERDLLQGLSHRASVHPACEQGGRSQNLDLDPQGSKYYRSNEDSQDLDLDAGFGVGCRV